MRIAILNNSALTDRHINRLKQLGDVVAYKRTVGEVEAIQRLAAVDIAIVDCTNIPIGKKLFQELPMLKYICLNSTGYEEVDLEAAIENGITISNVPDYSTNSVAEHTIALMLSLARHLSESNKTMFDNPFEIELSEKAHHKFLGQTLNGKTLGIIGLGKIGNRVAELATAFGMKIIAYNKSKIPNTNITQTDLHELLMTSDFISINATYKKGLKTLLDEKEISKIKSNTFIINTARGELINEYALAKAIETKNIGGYATDVLCNKSKHNPLLKFNNVILTPHLGFFTDESLNKLADTILANVESFIANKPNNIIKSKKYKNGTA